MANPSAGRRPAVTALLWWGCAPRNLMYMLHTRVVRKGLWRRIFVGQE